MTGMELTAIRTVVDTARSYLGSNYNLHKKTREMLDDLHTNLPRIQIAIKWAEQRPFQSEDMNEWLKKLKEAAMKAEDVLDDFEAEAIRTKLKGRGKVSEFASSSMKIIKTLIFSDSDLKSLEKAVCRLQEVCSGVGDFLEMLQLNDVIEESTNADKNETSSFLLNNMKFFGRDKEIELILDLILGHDPFITAESSNNPEPKNEKGKLVGTEIEGRHIEVNNWSLGVLPIVGVKGVGKTTLAQIIYNNQAVKKHFALQGWVYVCDNFDAKRLIHKIIYSFMVDKHYNQRNNNYSIDPEFSLDVLCNELSKIIRNMKFFLVLDDVWDSMSYSTWNRTLWSVLTRGAPGSVILVTTQLESVANMIRTFPSVKLDALSWEYFWPLFKYYAFGHFKFGDDERNILLPPKEQEKMLESVGEKIAKKMFGMPLEAEIVGSLLCSNLNIDNWIKISESNWWNDRDASKYIYPSLGVGYQNLSPQLKQSFLYCTIFPKGYVFEKDRLVQMWLSNGFVHPTLVEKTQLEKGEKRLEDIGNEMFDMLVDRFFFQSTVWRNSYVMHDVIRDLAIVISLNQFCIINNDSESIPPFTCHLALNNDHLVKTYDDDIYVKLRTLMFPGCFKEPMDNVLITIFKKPSSLRLLDLSYKIMGTNGFPNVYKQLSHLRYLDISFTGINFLPDAISLLCHLQVLDLRGCEFKKLSKEINKLINLRHLYASVVTISLISGIGKLVNLQELEEFTITSEEGHRISELKDLNKIRGSLYVKNLGNDTKTEADGPNLMQKKHVDRLALEWACLYPEKSNMEIAERLQPPSNLQELRITKYPWTHFPKWMIQNNKQFYKLQLIQIEGGGLAVLPPLGELPSLKILILKSLYFIEQINFGFYGSNEVVFSSLKELILIDMYQWEEWSGVQGRQMFPHLRKLFLEGCHKLKEVPVDLLKQSVAEIHIAFCHRITTEIGAILRQMTTLTQLTIIGHDPVPTLPCFEYLKSVEVLSLDRVTINMVEGIKYLKNLKKLRLNHVDLELPQIKQGNEDIQPQHELGLHSLTYLILQRMKSRNLLTLGRLPLLRTLLISSSYAEFRIEHITWLKHQTSLEELEFCNCHHLVNIPSDISMFSSLKKLTIRSCYIDESLLINLPQNLEDLKFSLCSNLMNIPSSISTIFSLKKLTITHCSPLASLANRLPQNLKELRIINCSKELFERCAPDQGADWKNISHIPYFRIVEDTIYNRFDEM